MIGFLQQLHWREPWWLLLALQPLLLWLIYRTWQGRQRDAYAQPHLQPWVVRTESQSWRQSLFSRRSAYALAWILFALAAAGPRLPQYAAPVYSQLHTDKGMNIMVVLDVSRSMTVNDILPNRLRRGEIELHELLSRAGGQRVGLIVYAARPHLFVPLTWDLEALRYFLQSLDKLVLPTRGSNLKEALVFARDTLRAAPQFSVVPSAIVLISDGDNMEDVGEFDGNVLDNEQALTEELAELDLPVYVLGVGSGEGGSIPLPEGGWLSYQGRPVISRMQESRLQVLANTTGGRYHRASDDDSDWQYLYDQGVLGQLGKVDDSERMWQELYPWVLFPAILLFFAATIPLRVRSLHFVGNACVIIAVTLGHNTSMAAGAGSEQQAYKAYHNHDYQAASKLYAERPGYSGRIGEGAAHYRLGKYQSAVRNFSDAVLQADTQNQRADALLNLGNSYFQQGDFENATRTFEDVLRYLPNHAAARHNLQISKQLQRQVSEIIIDQDATTMVGRGPRSARSVRDLSITDQGGLAIDDNEENQKAVIPPLPEAEQQAWQELIRKGLQHVQVAGGGEDRSTQSQRRQELEQARLFMLQLQDQPAVLWQRLFEREEGFAAPQTQSHEIPGVAPW